MYAIFIFTSKADAAAVFNFETPYCTQVTANAQVRTLTLVSDTADGCGRNEAWEQSGG